MPESAPQIDGVLETVLYYDSATRDETRRFYDQVLGLKRVVDDPDTFRIGDQVVLLFDHEESSIQSSPPPHGAVGSVHTCFTCPREDYDRWKDHLSGVGVTVIKEITWKSGIRSFYFKDPAGNMLEIAEGDLWPK